MSIEMALREMVSSLSPLEVDVNSISSSTDLIQDLGYNSIALVQLVIKIEAEFNFEFDDAMLGFEVIVVFSKLVDYVEEKVALTKVKNDE